jgi:hypothetical protein
MIEYLPLVLTGIGIIASILYYASVLRNASKTRELQIFMAIVNDLNTEEKRTTYAETLFEELTDYDDFIERFSGNANPIHYGKRSSLWWTYNSMGILLKRGHISIDVIDDLVGLSVVLQWKKWGDIILEHRTRRRWPSYYTGFEYLANELMKIQETIPELFT